MHAVWHFSSIEFGWQRGGGCLYSETIVKSYKKAVSRILSGIKINIPEDLKLMDRLESNEVNKVKVVDGFMKNPMRIAFITDEAGHFNRGPAIDELSDLELYNEKDKPVFTGHYCYRPIYLKYPEMWFA